MANNLKCWGKTSHLIRIMLCQWSVNLVFVQPVCELLFFLFKNACWIHEFVVSCKPSTRFNNKMWFIHALQSNPNRSFKVRQSAIIVFHYYSQIKEACGLLLNMFSLKLFFTGGYILFESFMRRIMEDFSLKSRTPCAYTANTLCVCDCKQSDSRCTAALLCTDRLRGAVHGAAAMRLRQPLYGGGVLYSPPCVSVSKCSHVTEPESPPGGSASYRQLSLWTPEYSCVCVHLCHTMETKCIYVCVADVTGHVFMESK